MQPKMIFPHFWRRKQDQDAPAKSSMTEAPVNKPNTQEPTPSGPRGELLTYEDIYRAVGIMEAVLPHPVADDGHRKRARLVRPFFGKKSAPENRLHFKHVKVVCRHKFRP